MKRKGRGLGWARGERAHRRDADVDLARAVEPGLSHSAALRVFGKALRDSSAAGQRVTGWEGKVL